MNYGRLVRNGLMTAILIVSLASMIIPTHSWVYQDGTPEDTKFEKFGPRADKLLIKLYATDVNMWQGLAEGDIDTTDTPLTPEWYDLFTNPPYNETINVVKQGPEFGFYMLDINNVNTTSSPVYPNPCTVVSFRQAIAHLVDRIWLDSIIGIGKYVPIWVPMSPALGKYYLNIPNPYPFDPSVAEALLDGDGFPVNLGTGWRFWDRNGNGVEDLGEYLELKFVIRVDHSHRLIVGDLIADMLNSVQVRVNRIYATAAQVRLIVMINRDFHLYTGSYTAESDPTYLYYYFHSSMIPTANYNSIDDAELDSWLEALLYAPTQKHAVVASRNAQQVFVNKSFKVPIWVYANHKAMYRRYTGGTGGLLILPDDGENQYRNKYWQGTVNLPGHGIDNFWSFLNMHPTGYAYGHNGNMTIRHGFSHPSLSYLNPVYASFPWDWQVLDLIYDRLMRPNPANITEWMPWIAKNFTVGTYLHPFYGNCTKVSITLRTDVTWHDGTPLTTADVYFTLHEIAKMLETSGYPPPWWSGNVEPILDFKIFDPFSFEVLFDAEGYWALSWIGNTPILPKHVWKPIVEIGNPLDFAPDRNLIGSGPWRLKEYVEESHILMMANRACRTVQTNLLGSQPIHSPYGYFQFYPVHTDVHFEPPYEHRHKIPPWAWTETKVTLENSIQETVIVENITAVDLSNPVSSGWNETWPTSLWPYFLFDWLDEGNGLLGPSDIVAMALLPPPFLLEWNHVEQLLYEPPGPYIMILTPAAKVDKYLYLDGNLISEPEELYLKPGVPHEQQLLFMEQPIGRHALKVSIHVEEPNWNSWKLNCTWINYTFTYWVTISEDIVGSYWVNPQLHAPDFKVDIRDIAIVALAFGSYPGHPRWNPFADISCDYKIDIKDVARIAKMFGWPW